MDLGDMVNSAKDALTGGGSSDAVDGVVDQAVDAIQEKTPDQADGIVEQGGDAIKGAI